MLLVVVMAYFLGALPNWLHDDTYFEANELAYRAWEAAEGEKIALDSLSTPIGNTVCIILNNGFSPLNLYKIKGGPEIKRILHGQIIDDWQLESLYKVVFVDEQGNAVVWNFDERLFEFVLPQGSNSTCYLKQKLNLKIRKKDNGKNRFTSIELFEDQ